MLPHDLIKATLQWQEYHQHDEIVKTDLGRSLLGFFYALTVMADKKQQDYGSRNLTDFGPRGVLMRMYDKANRVRNLYFRQGREHIPAVVEEHVLETWGDWIIYEGIGWLMEAKLWPEGKGPVPNEPILEQAASYEPALKPVVEEMAEVLGMRPAVTVKTSKGHATPETLIRAARRVCIRHAETRHLGPLPEIGRRYFHPRHPGTVVQCAAVMPDFHDHSTVGVMVLFHYVAEATSELEPCYVVSPLDWFNDHFPKDHDNDRHTPSHPARVL